MVVRNVVVGAVLATVLLWFGPVSVPNWAMSGFVFAVLLPLGVLLTFKRLRIEARLARSLWLALTRK